VNTRCGFVETSNERQRDACGVPKRQHEVDREPHYRASSDSASGSAREPIVLAEHLLHTLVR